MPNVYQHILTDEQRVMYSLEEEDNFRTTASLLGSRSPHTLTKADLAPSAVVAELSELGQFAEVAHVSQSAEFIWRNLPKLCQPEYPFHGYNALLCSQLVHQFVGEVADARGCVVYRPVHKQLVVALSCRASSSLAMNLADIRLIPFPVFPACRIHAGIWRVYMGLLDKLETSIEQGLQSFGVEEIAIAGHGVGGALATILAIGMLECICRVAKTTKGGHSRLCNNIRFKFAVFGAPRVGDANFVQNFALLVEQRRRYHGYGSFTAYQVKAYNDGVTSLPPLAFGFRHISTDALYLQHGTLYRLPPDQSEHAYFDIVDDTSKCATRYPKPFPRGGHNYYNSRDMEKCWKRMHWLELDLHGEVGWEIRYEERLVAERAQVSELVGEDDEGTDIYAAIGRWILKLAAQSAQRYTS